MVFPMTSPQVFSTVSAWMTATITQTKMAKSANFILDMFSWIENLNSNWFLHEILQPFIGRSSIYLHCYYHHLLWHCIYMHMIILIVIWSKLLTSTTLSILFIQDLYSGNNCRLHKNIPFAQLLTITICFECSYWPQKNLYEFYNVLQVHFQVFAIYFFSILTLHFLLFFFPNQMNVSYAKYIVQIIYWLIFMTKNYL